MEYHFTIQDIDFVADFRRTEYGIELVTLEIVNPAHLGVDFTSEEALEMALKHLNKLHWGKLVMQ